MVIDQTAVIGKKTEISSDGVRIGPYVIIEDGVKIGPRVIIGPHACICEGTEIGEDTRIHAGAVIGNIPQDLAFKGFPSRVVIGKRNVIREYVTIHRGTEEGSVTKLGDDNFFMVSSHAGHNCVIGSRVIVSNGALLAGYVTVEDFAFISGNVVIHQYCTIGRLAMIGGFSGVNKDVPPYMLVRGPSMVRSVNLIGLRRAHFSNKLIGDIKEAFRYLYRSDLNISQAIEKMKSLQSSDELHHLIQFVDASKRGICDAKYIDEKFFG